MLTNFSRSTEEALKHYVYLLVDPRDKKIFYIGKGQCDRVFNHIQDALQSESESDKLNIIRDIHKAGLEVDHYIVRHGLENEHDAFLVESVLIDLLTFREFSSVANITNIQAGHHQFDRGIKTAEELEALYNGGELTDNDFVDRVLTININKTYDLLRNEENGLYEATRKSWILSPKRAHNVQFVLGEYRGIIRAIFVPEEWTHEKNNPKRWMFKGYEVTEQNNPEIYHRYINKHVYKKKGTQNPLHYYNV